jgi:hypothetical protein
MGQSPEQQQQQARPRDSGTLAASHRELLALVETHYERTGDPALKDVLDRAKRASKLRG